MEKDGTDNLSGNKPSKHVTFHTSDTPELPTETQSSQVVMVTPSVMEVPECLKEDEAGAIVCQAYAPKRTPLPITRNLPQYVQSNSKYGIDAALQKYTEVLPPFVLRQNRHEKQQLVGIRGPGYYDNVYTSFVDEAKPCSTRCSLSTLVPRFKTDIQTHPGPGAYNLSSALAVVSKPGSVVGSARVQPMDINTRVSSATHRIKAEDSVGPGVYNLVPPMDRYLATKRFGLMDVYQAPRGKHMGTMERNTYKTRTGPGLCNIPIHDSSLSHRTKALVGRLLKSPRFCPGRKFVNNGKGYLVYSKELCTPAHYPIRELSRPENVKNVSFNQSSTRDGPRMGYTSAIPPCRYFPDGFYEDRNVNGHSNIFKSKSQRFPELQSHEKSSKKSFEHLSVRKIVGEQYGSADAKREWEEEEKVWRQRRTSDASSWGRGYYYRK